MKVWIVFDALAGEEIGDDAETIIDDCIVVSATTKEKAIMIAKGWKTKEQYLMKNFSVEDGEKVQLYDAVQKTVKAAK